MSTNNLDVQLGWLLDAKPFVPPVYALQSILDSLPTPPATQQQSNGQESFVPDSVALSNNVEPGTCAPQLASPIESDMARLRAAPSSPQKPQLFCQISALVTTAKPRSETNYTSRDESQRRRNSDVRNRFPPIEDFHAKPDDPYAQSQHNTPRFNSAIATIDLTGDPGIGSSTSGDSSPSRRTSDSLACAGRKRKSEEYEQDLPGSLHSRRTGLSRELDLEQEDDDDFHSIDSPVQKLLENKSTTNQVTGSEETEGQESYPDRTNASPLEGKETVYGHLASKLDHSSQINIENGENAVHVVGPRTVKDQTSPHQQTFPDAPLPDSMDELKPPDGFDNTMEGHSGTAEHKQELLGAESTHTIHNFNAKLNASQTCQEIKLMTPPETFDNGQNLREVNLAEANNYDEVLCTSTDSNETVVSFSRVKLVSLRSMLKARKEEELSVWNAYVDAVANGDETDSSLEEELDLVRRTLHSFQQLLLLRQEYSSCTSARNSIKARFRDLLGPNTSPERKAALKTELQEATKHWREIEKKLILQIQISQVNQVLEQNSELPSPIAVPSTQNTRFKNAATQTSPKTERCAPQFVQQTQVPRIPFESSSSQNHQTQPNYFLETRDKDGDFNADDDEIFNHMQLDKVDRERHPSSRPVFAEISNNITYSQEEDSPVNHHVKPAFSSVDTLTQQFPWSRDVKTALVNTFRLKGFRLNQLDTINATLSGNDVFVLMPTGGGKSLCYQLPAIIGSGKTKGVTVVVSPLLSLMEDQVEHLKKLRIQAVLLNGECDREQRDFVMNTLKDPRVEESMQLLYVTPEMLSKSPAVVNALSRLHSNGKLARIVIDEAHCVSQWGHDFRPDYKELGQVRSKFSGVPVMALTATATKNVRSDVEHNLNMRGCKTFTQSFNRPNLKYEVIRKKPKTVLDEMADTIKEKYSNQAGIIYCLSRKKCEEVAEALRKQHNIKAHHYHAHVDPQEKREIQAKWQSGQYKVIVATIAFGMGIDKPDVRFVMHHSLPKSLEGYYQETGRAGRDGQRSGCYLYYSYQDCVILRQMIKNGDIGDEQKERQNEMLRMVVAYCENKADCRRQQVLRYFGEEFSRDDCQASCDNCNSTSTFVTRDFTEHAKRAVELVRQIQSNDVTLLQCVDILRGAKTKKISENNWDELDQFGTASELDRNDIERIFYRLLGEGGLKEVNKVNRRKFVTQYIGLGKNYRIFEAGRQSIHIQVKGSPGAVGDKSKGASRQTRVREKGEDNGSKTLPPPTYLSSPAQAAAKRVPPRQFPVTEDDGSDRRRVMASKRDRLHGYARDGDFVVSDPPGEDDQHDYGEDEDAFEIMHNPKPRRIEREASLSDPITSDEQMADLTELHKQIVVDFVREAREECKKIQRSKGLRTLPFTDTALRNMGITFPRDKEALLEIPGIDSNKVEAHGRRFLALIAKYQDKYESLKQDKPLDPNHEIIDLVDDENDDGGQTILDDVAIHSDDFSDGFDDLDLSAEETSAFFPPANGIHRNGSTFNGQNQRAADAPEPRNGSSGKKSTWNGKRKSTEAGRGNYHQKPKRSRGGSLGRGNAGVKKASSTSNMKTTSKRGGAGGLGRQNNRTEQRPQGLGGIGMMPT